MAKRSKRMQTIREQVDRESSTDVSDALAMLKDLSSVRFPESVDVSVNLGVDPRKSDQVVRGSTLMPNGTRQGVAGRGVRAGRGRRRGPRGRRRHRGMDDLAEQVRPETSISTS